MYKSSTKFIVSTVNDFHGAKRQQGDSCIQTRLLKETIAGQLSAILVHPFFPIAFTSRTLVYTITLSQYHSPLPDHKTFSMSKERRSRKKLRISQPGYFFFIINDNRVILVQPTISRGDCEFLHSFHRRRRRVNPSEKT